MNLVGERRKPAEGAKLSGAVKSGTIRGHDSGESRHGNAVQLFPVRAPKVHGSLRGFLISQAKGQRKISGCFLLF